MGWYFKNGIGKTSVMKHIYDFLIDFASIVQVSIFDNTKKSGMIKK